MKARKHMSRREFVAAGAASASFTFLPSRVLGRAIPPSEKLNVAFIGIGGYGARGLRELASQNIAAVCDVDWRSRAQIAGGGNQALASEVVQKYPGAKRFDDWRIMLQEMDKNIDAVLVCSADHTHAIASITAMKMGKHVFCEKPLAHSIHEVRAMMAAERKYKVSTQTGTQGHASEDCRSVVEWIRDGAIGAVKEIEVFQSPTPNTAPYYAGIEHVRDDVPVPPEVKWDLWLGPAPYRPFNPMYLPLRWRNWLDFGTGILGDHGPHFLDPVYWALDLGFPETIEAETDPDYDPEKNQQTFPRMSIVRYTFPAKGKRSVVTVTWHGFHTPAIPKGWKADKFPDGGAIVVGSKGTIVYGPMYQGQPQKVVPGMVTLLPEELDKEYKRPDKTLPRPQSHWLEWVECAKAGKQPSAHFGYGGPLTETCLLGNIAILHKGKRLNFDPKREKFTNSDSATKMFQPPAREGWALPV